MGDRANVVVQDGEDRVFLYTHWCGFELPDLLRKALVRSKGRWFDMPYLARIIFCEMIKDDVDGLTGFGISSTMQDWNRPNIIVDVPSQWVHIEPVDEGQSIPIYTFTEYASRPQNWDRLHSVYDQLNKLS